MSATKSTLYDLTHEGLQIFDMLSDNLGELTPELEKRLDKLMLEGPVRIEAAAMVVRTMDQNASACEAEAQRLRERAKEFEAQADRLKKRMTACLDMSFSGKVKTPLFTIWTQKSADRTVAELVPGVTPEMLHEERPDLVRVKMELNRDKAVSDFKAGNPLPELILFEEKEGSRYVRIK
jgi:hypothetical protein